MKVKKYRQINEEIYMDDIIKYHKQKEFKIYTSNDGIIEFGRMNLIPVNDYEELYNFENDFIKDKKTFDSCFNIVVDLDEMFVFYSTSKGDKSEYKIFPSS